MLTDRAKDSWSRNIPFEPKRGEIMDRNGVPLATNISAPTVYAVPRQIENPVETAEKLSAVLNMSKEKAYKLITKRASSVRIPEGRKISHEKAKEIRALGLKAFILEKTRNGIILLAIICHTFLDLQVLITRALWVWNFIMIRN